MHQKTPLRGGEPGRAHTPVPGPVPPSYTRWSAPGSRTRGGVERGRWLSSSCCLLLFFNMVVRAVVAALTGDSWGHSTGQTLVILCTKLSLSVSVSFAFPLCTYLSPSSSRVCVFMCFRLFPCCRHSACAVSLWCDVLCGDVRAAVVRVVLSGVVMCCVRVCG